MWHKTKLTQGKQYLEDLSTCISKLQYTSTITHSEVDDEGDDGDSADVEDGLLEYVTEDEDDVEDEDKIQDDDD